MLKHTALLREESSIIFSEGHIKFYFAYVL
jgi:hypothetical protein